MKNSSLLGWLEGVAMFAAAMWILICGLFSSDNQYVAEEGSLKVQGTIGSFDKNAKPPTALCWSAL